MNVRFYNGLRAFLKPFYSLLWPSRVIGLENIPESGGFIMCANHVHYRDPLFLAVRLKKRRYTYLAKEELFKNPIANRVLGDKGLGGIPVSRGNNDLKAVRAALQVVAEGHALGIFPQGTRSPDNTPTPMLNGVSMIAVRAGVPVIPVYLDGPYRLFRHVDVIVGAPIDLSDIGKRANMEVLNEVTRRIETSIWSLKSDLLPQ